METKLASYRQFRVLWEKPWIKLANGLSSIFYEYFVNIQRQSWRYLRKYVLIYFIFKINQCGGANKNKNKLLRKLSLTQIRDVSRSNLFGGNLEYCMFSAEGNRQRLLSRTILAAGGLVKFKFSLFR